MKTQFNTSIPVSTVDLVRERAREVEVNVGDLTDLFLRFAHERMPVETIRKWAASQVTQRGPLTKNERAIVDAFQRLPKKPGNELAWRFTHAELAVEAGMRHALGFDALKALQTRGLVVGTESAEFDKWDRPLKSHWSLISAMPEHAKPKGV